MSSRLQTQHPAIVFSLIAVGIAILHYAFLTSFALAPHPNDHFCGVPVTPHRWCGTDCGPGAPSPLDRTSRLTHCHVHGTALVIATVPIRYRYPLHPDPARNQAELFPFGHTFVWSPYFHGFRGPREAYVSQCSECLRQQEEWLAAQRIESVTIKRPTATSSHSAVHGLDYPEPSTDLFPSRKLLVPFSMEPTVDFSRSED